jgi:hydrogenase expression/formation protein HypE
MMSDKKRILLGHGSGGKLSYNLLKDLFLSYFDNEELSKLNDAAVLEFSGKSLIFSTDSFVVDPIFFPGGDIGKIAVCGTVNDLAVMGAKPLYLSVGFIIEEGLAVEDLEKILRSMKSVCEEAGIQIVTGDTKVVPKGAADKIFINTSGVGEAIKGFNLSGQNAKVGDKIIINGNLADHGITVMAMREGLELDLDLKTDSAPLNNMIMELMNRVPEIHVLRDPTRGGVATTLNEIAQQSKIGISIYEKDIPVSENVKAVCEILGLDPLYIANEGKVLVFTPSEHVDAVIQTMQKNKYGHDACVIGEVVSEPKSKVYMETEIGGQRMIDMLAGEQLPRIC